MAQHDYNIANQSGADFRADLNNALLAIATVNSGATEPSTTFAHQLWVDTSSSVLKIRNAADNAWITTGVSITASNTFTGDLTGDVTGNLTGNVTGNVTGDLTGNADSADTLSTARTISLSGDVVGSASFDGSANIDIDTVVQINSITLGTDTTGDYVESLSGGTGVTVTGGTGEGSTPSVAIGQAVATTDDVTFNIITASEEFIGDLEGGIRFNAKADGALSKGDVVYISGVSGDVPTVAQAKADDASKMPAFGLALSDANDNAELQVVTFGTIEELDTSGVSEGQILYVSTTAGEYTTTAPTGESSQIQNIGKVIRSHASAGSIKVGGAGRSNATPNLDNGKIFIGNASNQAITSTLDTSIVVENTNLYYTTTRANTDFDTRLATKDTGDLTEGSNLYYTTARVNSDFDTRLATKSTTDLAEGTNLYYTTARFDSAFTSKDTDDLSEGTTNLYYTTTRFDSAFSNKTTADLTENTNLYYTDTRANSAIDARVTKAFVDALGIQATSVAADSVALGTDTTGNYVSTITGTANKITVSGSGSESANITLSLPDDVQIADSLTVAGNLTVNGTLTSLDTTNLDIEDNLFQLNAGLTGSPVNDSGMLINRGTADNGIFMWDESVDKFTLGLTTADGSATGNITLNSLGTLVANIEGDVTGTVSSLSNHDTGDLTEGANLYYTDARSRSAISASGDISYNSSTGVISFTQSVAPVTSVNTQTGAVVLDTDDIGEGSTNVYFTNARADTRINLQTGTNLDLSSKSTSDLSEGSNLYYTDARVQAVSINNVVEDTTPQLGGNLASNGNDILFGDSDKAVFGAGSDLEIYSDGGSNNYILSNNGALILRNLSDDKDIYLQSDDGVGGFTSYLHAKGSSGEVILKHYGNNKLATTSTGIDVTGTVTADNAEIGTGGASNANAIVDLTGDTTYTDFGFRILRNSGANGNTDLRHRGTGNFNIEAVEAGNIVFETSDTERMRIDSSGNVGIGTSSPQTTLHLSNTTTAPILRLGNEDNSIAAGADLGVIQFYSGDDSGGGNAVKASISGEQNATSPVSADLTFKTAHSSGSLTEHLRITSLGSVLVGKTAVDNTTVGFRFDGSSGFSSFVRDGNAPLLLVRKSDDGDILLFKKDTTTVGSIGAVANNLHIQGIATGLSFQSNDVITPVKNNARVDATVDLGDSSRRFKDLYLSGTVNAATLNVDGGTIKLDGNYPTGTDNVALGQNALASVTTGQKNTAIGDDAMFTTTEGNYNVAVGEGAVEDNTTGGFNVGIGRQALNSNTTASNNTGVGYFALHANTTGADNTAVGALSLDANITGSYNAAFGRSALSASTGTANTGLGAYSLNSNTSASHNTGVGYNTLYSNTTGTQNVAVGSLALDAATTANNNTAIGYATLTTATTGADNVAVGRAALNENTTGSNNTAIGKDALESNSTASNNTALGYAAMTANTTGTHNTAVGALALDAATTATSNTAVGESSMSATTTGYRNSAFGRQSMLSNTTGSFNTAYGFQSLKSNTTSSGNTALGHETMENATGDSCVAVGGQALKNATGDDNTAVGRYALLDCTSGSNNTAVGYFAGDSITTGSGNTLIGLGADTTAADSVNTVVLGVNVQGATNYTTLGNGVNDIRASHGVATWAAVSDERYKKDIVDSTTGLSFINALQPRTFNYKTLGELPETFRAYKADSTEVYKSSQTQHGFIAQEVKAAIDADSSIKDGFKFWDEREDGSQEVAETALIPILVKALQEADDKIDALTARIEALET